MDRRIESLALTSLRESPTNPRRTFDDGELQQLADSIRTQGLLQPILVRPLTDAQLDMEPLFEVVFGHRRLRACELAGMEAIAAEVRAMTDLEVRLAQHAENLQRVDVTALEEADGYAAMRADLGMSADEIAEAVGKSRSHVFGRLKLAAATPPVREAMEAERLPADIALELARLSPAAQVLQLRLLKGQRGVQSPQDHGWPSVRQARQQIRQSLRLRISAAPWDEAETRFGPACGTCPKLARNDPDLAEAFDADVCTDAACYGAKHTRWADDREVEITERGLTVISGDEASKMLVNRFSGYTTLRGGLERLPDFLEADRGPGPEQEAVPILDALDELRRAGYLIPLPTVIRVTDPEEFIVALPSSTAYEVRAGWQQIQRGTQPQRGQQQVQQRAADDDEDDDTDDANGDLFGDGLPTAPTPRADPMAGWSADERAAVDVNVSHRLRMAVIAQAWAAPERTRGELLLLLRREIEMAGDLPYTVMDLSGLQAKWDALDEEQRDGMGLHTWLLQRLDDMSGADLARVLVCTALHDELDTLQAYSRADRAIAARRLDIAQAYGVSPAAVAEQHQRAAEPSESDDTTEALHG